MTRYLAKNLFVAYLHHLKFQPLTGHYYFTVLLVFSSCTLLWGIQSWFSDDLDDIEQKPKGHFGVDTACMERLASYTQATKA